MFSSFETNVQTVDPRKVKNAKDLPYMQRPGGSADDSDLSKKKPFTFSFGKKKEEKPAEAPKKKNFWSM